MAAPQNGRSPPARRASRPAGPPRRRRPGTVHAVDRDCDGEADATLLIAKARRKPDMLLADDLGDGEYDTIHYDYNHDGEPEYALYDTDGDGKYDLKGEFRKGEDEPYRWERITE
jgi:hypothetical protein